jgi:hypothetical protein
MACYAIVMPAAASVVTPVVTPNTWDQQNRGLAQEQETILIEFISSSPDGVT